MKLADELADKAASTLAADKRYPLNRYIFADVVSALKPIIVEALERAAREADNLECGDPTPRCTIAKRIRAL